MRALGEHKFVIVDYEGENFLLSPDILKKILRYHSQGYGKLILTLSARSRELAENYQVIQSYAKIALMYSNLGFCIVAGHPSYSSVDITKSTRKSIIWMVKTLRNLVSNETLIFIGMENLKGNFVSKLVQNFNLIPFFLKSEKLEQDLRELQSLLPQLEDYAVYSPINFEDDERKFLQQLIGYVLRRESSQQQLKEMNFTTDLVLEIITKNKGISTELQSFLLQRLSELTMYGQNIKHQCYELQNAGISIIVGHPSNPNETERTIRRFAEILA